MNYLCAVGLPTIGNKEGDRCFYDRKDLTACTFSGTNLLTNSITEAVGSIKLDFSDGAGGAIDENAINEAAGLVRRGGGAVDWNCSGATDATAYAFDLNSDSVKQVLTDFDDLLNLKFAFLRLSPGGTNNGKSFDLPIDPIGNDHQPVAVEYPHTLGGLKVSGHHHP